MGCLLVALAMFFPRAAIVFLLVFFDHIQKAMATTSQPLLFGILGFLFLPYTMLAYTYAIITHGSIDGQYQVLLIIAVLVDLGVLGGGAGARRRQAARARE